MECYHERAFYYWRHGLYGHVEHICKDGLNHLESSLFLNMYIGLAKAKLGDSSAALEYLDKMQQRSDLKLIYYVCAYCVEGLSKENKDWYLSSLSSEIVQNYKSANTLSLYYAAKIAWLFNIPKLFNLFLDRCQKTDPSNHLINSLRAWIYITNNQCDLALNLLEQNLETTTSNLSSLYAKLVCHSALNQYSDCIQTIIRIQSKYFFPELQFEKCRLYLSIGKWQIAKLSLEEGQSPFFSAFEMHLFDIYYSIYQGNPIQCIISKIDTFISNCSTYEKDNWRLLNKIVFSLMTISPQSIQIYDKIQQIVLIALERVENSETIYTLGFTQLYLHNYVAALNSLQKLNNMSDSMPMEFQIRLLIETDRLFEAQDAIDLLQIAEHESLQLYVLQAKLLRKSNQNTESILKSLYQALQNHLGTFKYVRKLPFGKLNHLELLYEEYIEYFIRFRADYVVSAFEELILYNESIVYSVERYFGDGLISLLESLVKDYPNYTPFSVLLSFAYEKVHKQNDSIILLTKVLLSPVIYQSSYCLILLAKLLYQSDDIELAIDCLEEASKTDPELINSLDFLIIQAQITSTVKESIPKIADLFETYQNVPVKTYLQFIDLCISVNECNLSMYFIKKASSLTLHPHEKVLLVLRQIKVYAYINDEKKAEVIIDKLLKHKKYENEIILAKAELYRDYFNENTKYISILHDYSNDKKTWESYMLLGDAYSKQRNFNSAIEMYKRCLKKNNNNIAIIQKIIMCCVSAHRLDDAISLFSHYQSIIRTEEYFSYQFINIMIKMKRYEEALNFVGHYTRYVNADEMISPIRIAFLALHGQILANLKDYAQSTPLLKLASEAYMRWLANSNANSYAERIRQHAANVFSQIGINYSNQWDTEKAIESFTKALSIDPINVSSVVQLFNLYKSRNKNEKCVSVCMNYLQHDPSNETVVLLLTSTKGQKLSESIPYLEKILTIHPYYFRILVRMIEFSARCGQLDNAKRFIKQAKCNDSGYHFVCGLYNQYKGNISKAIKFFNNAMSSTKWSLPAKMCLFSLLINPDSKFVVFEDKPLSTQANFDEAKELLKTIDCDELTHKLLYCDLLSSLNTDELINEAEGIYNELNEKYPHLIPALVGQARCLVKKGHMAMADTLLSVVLAGQPFHENFSYFEEAYLIYAHIISTTTNFAAAHNYVVLALELDTHCKKAWEMCAELDMKRKLYPEAAMAYRYLWQLSNKKDPEIGYNYAHALLKAKDYPTALIICREVFTIYPGYKDLKEKVLIPSFKKIKS